MSYTSQEALKALDLEILKILCIDKDFEKMTDTVTADVKAIHDGNAPLAGRDNFISHWQRALTAMPGLSYQIHDAVAEMSKDGSGGKVWVFSRISGLPRGISKDSVDMMDIDEDGRLFRMEDVQRAIVQ